MSDMKVIGDDADFSVPVEIPPRSVLFRLPPAGVGTVGQESLLSLIVRTSRAHCVSPRRLVREVFPRADPAVAKLGLAFFNLDGGTVNGLGRYAEMFTGVVARLTDREDLRHLTLLPWKDVFPSNGQGLLVRHPRWCPVCLKTQLDRSDGTVFPLIWSFDRYSVCLAHRVATESRCPACAKQQPFFPRYPDLALCHHCGHPLSAGIPRENNSPAELWVAEAIGDMVRRQSETGFTPNVRRFQDFVSAQVAAATGGNRAAFCRLLGFDPHGLRGWLDRGERPSFSQLLAFCYGVGILPGEIFGQEPPKATSGQLRKVAELRKERQACPRPTPARRKALEEVLKTALATGDYRPVSSIAAGHDISPRSLRYWFPDLCRALSDRYIQAVKANVAANQAMQCARMQETVRKVEAEGGYPSRRRVYALLHREGIWLSRSHVSEAYRKAIGSRFEKDARKT